MLNCSLSSSSSLSLCASTAHDDTCICAACEKERITINRLSTDKLYQRRKRKTDCINERNSCLCEFHIKYRAIKEKDALAHASRRQKMTTPEKVTLTTNNRNKKNDRKLIKMNQLADSLRSETLTNYTIASKNVFSRHEIDEMDNNLDFDKYAGTHFIYSKRYNIFNFITN